MGADTFLETLRGTRSERIPYFIRDMTLGMDVLGIRTTDVFGRTFDPERSSDCIVAFRDFTGQDAVIGCTHSAAFLIEQFGGTMKYPEYGIPVPTTHPLENVTDFSGYDPVPGDLMKLALRSYALTKARLPDTAVILNVTGPLTKAGVLAGMEYISMLSESDPDVLEDMLALCMENLSEVVRAACSDGSCDAGLLASATDNPDLFGTDIFERFSVPWTCRYVNVMHECGIPAIYHPHGTFFSEGVDLSEDILRTGCDGFHFPESNDLSIMKDRLGDRVCLLGGTDIVPTLMNGPAEKICEETEGYLDSFEDVDYIFTASCSVHRGIPLENIRTMCDTIRRRNSP